MARRTDDIHEDTPVFIISVAAELSGMHAQTLRQYDRLGLVIPHRTQGGGRRYSSRDVELLREVQRLSQAGVSLAGIQRVLELRRDVDRLRAKVADLTAEVARVRSGQPGRIFAVNSQGDVLTGRFGERPRIGPSQALVVWRSRQTGR